MTLVVRFGDAPHTLTLTWEAPPDASGLYLTLHIGRGENPDRLVVDSAALPVPLQLSVLYDLDGPDVGYDLLLSSGATESPLRIAATLDGAAPVYAFGTTARPISATLPLPVPRG